MPVHSPPSARSESAPGCEPDSSPEQQTAVDKALILLKSSPSWTVRSA